jgi:hypothetical protein
VDPDLSLEVMGSAGSEEQEENAGAEAYENRRTEDAKKQ